MRKISCKDAKYWGLGDTKATVNYQFPLCDTEKLASYYHDCDQELPPGRCTYFLYIAGGFKQSQRNIVSLLRACAGKFGRPVSAVTVEALLDLVDQKQRISPNSLEEKFKEGKLFTSAYSFF